MKRMISSSSKPVTAAEENEVLDDAIENHYIQVYRP